MTRSRVFLIAEAGVNHNGSLERALGLVDAAVAAGADAVKFQTFRAAALVTRSAGKARYQRADGEAAESQFDMLERLELDEDAHRRILAHCAAKGIQFLSTPFDPESVDLLALTLDLPLLKLPSGEITNAPLLLKAACSGKPVLLSTSMSTLADIEVALGVLAFGYLRTGVDPSVAAFREAYLSGGGQRALQEKVTLLHCTTEYPAPFAEVNLRAMDTMAAAFGLPVGFSDHTEGITVAVAAVARGAIVIEKHFTLDRNLPGPDHRASLEPDELLVMVRAIRQVEEALGSPRKLPARSEQGNAAVARKSLVATRGIRAGEAFSEQNLGVKRPGTGLAPLHYWELLGCKARRDFAADDLVEL